MRVGALEKHVECCLADKDRSPRHIVTVLEENTNVTVGDVAKANALPRSCCITNTPSVRRNRLGEGCTTFIGAEATGQGGGTPLNHESQEVRGDITNNNAFAKIMRTARLASFNEEFWVIRNSQGQLRWGWGVTGSGPTPKVVPRAWTSKIISSKATGSYCVLWTNVPSADEGHQPNPSHSTGLSQLPTACVKVIDIH